jgi:hypothetical protein
LGSVVAKVYGIGKSSISGDPMLTAIATKIGYGVGITEA